MPIDDETQDTVRALWRTGQDHGRSPSPVPEADPWEDDPAADLLDGSRPVTVVFAGVPDVVVHLHRGGQDVVAVEGCVDLDVPRSDVVAVVDALLSGRARRRPRVRGALRNLASALLGSPAPSDLEVRVGALVHAAPIVFAPPFSGWLLALPTEDPGGPRA